MPPATRKRKLTAPSAAEALAFTPAVVRKPATKSKRKAVVVSPVRKVTSKVGKSKSTETGVSRRKPKKISRQPAQKNGKLSEVESDGGSFEAAGVDSEEEEVDAAPKVNKQMSDRRTNIERELRILELEKELAEMKFTKAQAPPHAAQGLSTNPGIIDHATVRSRLTMSSG